MGVMWDASPSTSVTGYNVYYGNSSGNYSSMINAGANLSATLSNLAGGKTYYIAVTAFDSLGNESVYSSEVSFAAPGVNQPPTIGAIANKTISSGQSTGAIPFTVGDPDTGPTGLTLSGASANTTLVPNGNIAFGGSGASRTVTVTPATGQTGSAQITVTVSDGSLTAQTNFTVTVQAQANHAPTITAIATQNISAGQNTGAIPFTVGDQDTGAAGLTISAASSNTTLVPNGNVVFGGSGANRTVTVTPAAGQSGTAKITVTVSDGSLTAQSVFTVNVQAQQVNHAPTISAISNQTISAGQNTGAIPFTIADQDTGAAGLILTAASSNPTMVLAGNVVFGGSGGKRTVTVTPVAGKSGSSLITITVSDGSLSTQSSFMVTVQAAQAHAPTITAIPAQSTFEGVPTSGISFTINDADTGPASLTLSAASSNQTLVPNGNIVFAGSGGNRTVTVTPAAGQTGSVQITITVSDGSLTAQSSFALTVQVATALPKSALPKSTSYNGLFYEQDSVRLQSAGSLKITASSAGKYSGSLQMAAGKYSFTGVFGTFCVGTNVIARKVGSPLYIGFSLKPGATAGQLVGSLSDGTWTAQINGGEAVYNSKTRPAPFAGSYTLTVPGTNPPAFSLGNGFGSLTVDGNGNVKFSGSLADGSKVTQSSGLTVDGAWPLFIPLYSGQGMVMGWVSFTNRIQDDLNGPVNWIKTANPVSKYYPDGLALQSATMEFEVYFNGAQSAHVRRGEASARQCQWRADYVA